MRPDVGHSTISIAQNDVKLSRLSSNKKHNGSGSLTFRLQVTVVLSAQATRLGMDTEISRTCDSGMRKSLVD